MGRYFLSSWDGKVSTSRAFWINLAFIQVVKRAIYAVVLVSLYVGSQVPLAVIDLIEHLNRERKQLGLGPLST